MKHSLNKTLVLGGLLLAGSLMLSQGYAAKGPRGQLMMCHPVGQKAKHWRKFNRKLTSNDARVLAEAKLIRQGRKHLKIGKVIAHTNKKGRKLFIAQITTQKGEVVERLAINPKTGRMRPFPVA